MEHQDIQVIGGVEHLPDEILVMIFSQLRQRSYLKGVLLVCKQWAKNAVGLLWGYILFKDGRLVWRTLATPGTWFNYRSMVKVVCLDSNVADNEVLPDAKFRLKALKLLNCRLTETGLAPLVQDITSLRVLKIVDEHDNAGIHIRTIANRCTTLRRLKIRSCKTSLQSLSTLTKSCKDLKQLCDEHVLALAENCRNIMSFRLHDCGQITSASVAVLISNCNNLRELQVERCDLVDHVAFLGLPDKALKNLWSLSLQCRSLTNAAISPITRAAPRIQYLYLNQCSITDAALPAISRLQNLNTLHVLGNAGITTTGLQALKARCTNIREIDSDNFSYESKGLCLGVLSILSNNERRV
ncbi:hypothetical protein MY5147_008248 [Beauveria neobassiana]